MTKLLTIINDLHAGEAKNFAFNLSEQLQKDYNYQISFAYLIEEETTLSRILQKRLSQNFELYSLRKKSFPGLNGLYKSYFCLKNLISKNKFDLLFSQCKLPHLLTAIVPGNIPKIRSLQNYKEWVNNPVFGKITETNFISKRFDFNIAVSRTTKESWCKNYGISEKKVSVIPNGVDDLFFKHAKPRTLTIKDKLKIVAVGRLEKQKGHIYLLQAVAHLKNEINIEVNIVGIGGLEERLKESVNTNDLNVTVIFHGSISKEQLIELYNRVDILVMPSLFEGLPLTVIEAMAVGLPVIGSCVPGIMDCINESNGILFQAKSVQGLVEKIRFISSSPHVYSSISENAVLNAKDYSYANIAEQYHEVIVGLLQKNRTYAT